MYFFRIILLFVITALCAVAETRVSVTGVKNKSEQEVLAMMGGRLTYIKAAPASAPLADDAAFILRKLLKNDGYADATVDWKIKGSNQVELIVNEGIRLSLGEVTVSGVPEEDAKKLSRIYAKPAEVGREIGGEAPPFREEDVETGLSYLRQELNSRGFWEAEVTETKRATDPDTGAVNMIIDAQPGTPFRIGKATIESKDPKEAAPAIATAHSFIGKSASTQNLNAMRVAVEESVASSGYPDAVVQMSRKLQGNEFVPEFSIVLGVRVRLGSVDVKGLERTKRERIVRRVRGMEGDWYDSAEMNIRIRQFLATGAFSSARVERIPTGDGSIDVVLHFEEAKAREFTLGFGAGTYQGMIIRAGYTDRNIFGRLVGLNAGIEMSFLGLLGDVRVVNPWIFGTDVAASARLYALIYDREGYDAATGGLEATLSRKFGDHYRMDLLAGYSYSSLSEDGLPEYVLGETSYTNPRLRFSQFLDYRDNPVLPKSGWHLESPLEIGAAVGDETTSYVMGGVSGGWYRQINRKFDIGVGGAFGVIMPSGDVGALPIDLRLFNGGPRSVRSFPERELGPEVNGYPTGGEATWHTNFEVIRKFGDSLRAVAFVDAGALSQAYDDIGSAKINIATGLGVRLDLPIGPVRFEYGFNLTRDSGEPSGTFHFAIGTAY